MERAVISLSAISLLVFLILINCLSCSSIKKQEIISGSEEEQVIFWLKQVRFLDPPKGCVCKDCNIDWKAWYQSGSKINNSEEILIRFLKERDKRVYLPQVAFALGSIGTEKSMPALIEALSDEDELIRIEAASSLKFFGCEKVVRALCKIVVSDNDVNVVANACISLGEIGNKSAIEFLRIASKHPLRFVSQCAKDAIIKLEKPSNNK